MAVLSGSAVTEDLKTTTNTAYEIMKQREQEGRLEDDYDIVSSPPGGPHQPLPLPPVAPPTYINVGVAEEAEGVYEIIPGDK